MSLSEGGLPLFLSSQVLEAERFYLDLNPTPGPKLTVVCGGWERCSTDYRMERSGFPFYGLECVTGGKGMLRLDGKDFPLHRGVVFTYGPQVAHEIVSDTTERLEKTFVDFTGNGGLDLMLATGLMPGSCRMLSESEQVESTLQSLIRAGQRSGSQVQRIAALLLEVVMLQIADASAFELGQEQSHQTFLKCRRWIDDHCLEISTAEDVAEACHVHPAYLARLFTKHGNETPYRYLIRKKMMHAANLLDAGGRIVREVAEQLGMDAFHFSKVFKRVHGVPPTDFVKRRKGWGEVKSAE